jgi:hypothetical protein
MMVAGAVRLRTMAQCTGWSSAGNQPNPKVMEIKLSQNESEQFFLNALSNGLTEVMNHGLALDYDQKAYRKCSKRLRNLNNGKSPCFEDVLMEILRKGGKLQLIDEELDGGLSSGYSRAITIDMVHERVQEAPVWAVMQMVNGADDAITADVIIQWVAYRQVIFG